MAPSTAALDFGACPPRIVANESALSEELLPRSAVTGTLPAFN